MCVMFTREAIRALEHPGIADQNMCFPTAIAWALRLSGESYSPAEVDKISGRVPGQGVNPLEQLRVTGWLIGKGYKVEEVFDSHIDPKLPVRPSPELDAAMAEYDRLVCDTPTFSWDKYTVTDTRLPRRKFRQALKSGAVVVFAVVGQPVHSAVAAGHFTGDTTSWFDPAKTRVTLRCIDDVVDQFIAQHERSGWPALILHPPKR